MRKFTTTLVVATFASFVGAFAVLAQAVPVDGQVVKVDEAAGKLTLKHGPIKNLDMDGMTMAFRVKDPAMLKTVRVGDQVKFEAERLDGTITVTKIEKKK